MASIVSIPWFSSKMTMTQVGGWGVNWKYDDLPMNSGIRVPDGVVPSGFYGSEWPGQSTTWSVTELQIRVEFNDKPLIGSVIVSVHSWGNEVSVSINLSSTKLSPFFPWGNEIYLDSNWPRDRYRCNFSVELFFYTSPHTFQFEILLIVTSRYCLISALLHRCGRGQVFRVFIVSHAVVVFTSDTQ